MQQFSFVPLHQWGHRLRTTLPLLFFTIIALLTSCDHVFDVHPYDMNISGEHNINATNIAKIQSICEDKDTIRFAVISDSHLYLTDLADQVKNINRRDSIDFVLHLGDLTETGTTKEFDWTRSELQKFNKPYVVLIGNHDFLSTKIRINAFVGQGITKFVPKNKAKFVKSLTFFYELSTCDLYVHAAFLDDKVKLSDIIGLSLGLKILIL